MRPEQDVAVLVGVEAAALLGPFRGVRRLDLVLLAVIGAVRGGGDVVPVHGRDVVAVGAVLGLQLPVAVIGVGGRAAQHLQPFVGLVDDHVDHLARLAEVVFQRLHVGIERPEQEAAVVLEPRDLRQVVAAVLVELLGVARALGVLHLQQLAGVREGPAVERAGEGLLVAALEPAELRAAVRTGVDQRVQLAVLVAGDDDRACGPWSAVK